MRNVAPGALSRSMSTRLPPCASAAHLAMDRPSPDPPFARLRALSALEDLFSVLARHSGPLVMDLDRARGLEPPRARLRSPELAWVSIACVLQTQSIPHPPPVKLS